MMLKPVLFSFAAILVVASQTSAAIIYSQTQSGSVGSTTILTFTGALPAASDATLSLIAKPGGELFNNNKRLEQLLVDGNTYQTPGNPAGWILPVNFLDGGGVLPPPVTIPLADLIGFVADGQVSVSVTRPGFLSGGVFDLVLEYTSVPEPASGLLLVLGMAGVALPRRWRRSP
ncbi:MAG: PEP-CTERM sorting domain-containing protein [Planctomycetes bacterium]|nr:PEP-CTERM sorting domain-containing protein [Planctomycetota bacterium]